MNQNNSKPLDEEVLEGARELEALVSIIPESSEELNFQLMMVEIVDQIQSASSIKRQSAALRKLVARFGDAYFFYNPAGEFCLLADFSQKNSF